MRKLLSSAVFAVLALAAAGVAVAQEGDSRSTKAVSATFSAESGDHSIRTCQGADGRYRRVSGLWEGESKSADEALDGELMIKGTAWIHVATGNGAFEGRLRIGGEGGVHAGFHAVLKEGKLEGFAVGKAGKREQHFLANISAAFGPEEITEGKIGGGGGANTAVFVKGSCPPRNGETKNEERKKEEAKKEGEKKAERKLRELEGVVSAVGEGSITVAADGKDALSCSFGERVAAELRAGGYVVGTKVYAACVDEGQGLVLVKIKKL